MKIDIKGLTTRQKEIAGGIFSSSGKYHTVNASRQSGKTFMLSRLVMGAVATSPKEKILVVAPSYEQVRITFEHLIDNDSFRKFIKGHPKISKPYTIECRNGCKVHFKSGDRPEFIRGGSYKWVFIDEFAFFKGGVFDAVIVPTTAAKQDSKIVAVSTPKGVANSFHDLCELGQEEENTKYSYYFMHYSDNPYYDLGEVEAARKRYPLNLFLQEYEGKFIRDGGEVFINFGQTATLSAYEAPASGHRYFAGIDWGRVGDDTVLTVMDESGRVVSIDKYVGDWKDQITLIAAKLLAYKAVTLAESNGIGDPLVDQLLQHYSNVEPFVMTNSSKKNLVETLNYDTTIRAVTLPDKDLEPELHVQLGVYTFKMSSSGNVIYSHPVGGHDDFVDSLMIANKARHSGQGGFNYYTE